MNIQTEWVDGSTRYVNGKKLKLEYDLNIWLKGARLIETEEEQNEQ